jgi:monovalent cation/hydrogen antiporter
MELTVIAIVSVVAIVAVAAVSQRIAVAAPLSLVVVDIGLSFLPGLPKIQVDPEWILAGALPPLLYATAVHMPAHDFRRDFKAIAGLAVLLVVLTTVCSGLLFLTRAQQALDLLEATLQQVPDLAEPGPT